jgi:acyl-CoA thioesterase I
MARKLQSPHGIKGACAGVVTVLLAVSFVWAQSSAPAPAVASAPAIAAMPAPFSRDCQVGNAAIGIESPLPNVAAALQQRRRVRILAIGASSATRRTARRGGHTEETKQILEDAIKGLDVVMINRGVSGELSAQAAARIQNEVALNEPDLVLWQVGTNDAMAYVPLDDFENTVTETLRWLRAHKVDVVLVGLQYVDRMEQDANYRAVRQLLRSIADRENVMIVRRYEAQRLLNQAKASGGGLLPDEFQQSEEGYICLAQYLARAITLGVFGDAMKLRSHPSYPDGPLQ